jgi:hypothetical protein
VPPTFTQASPSRRPEVISPKHAVSMLVGSMTAIRGDRKGIAMNESLRHHWYVSRRVEAPAFVVTDIVRWLLADGPITVEADRATLTVGPAEPAGIVWPSRDAVTRAGRGRLGRTRRWPAARRAVDLEVEAWSEGSCELALRPTGRHLPADPTAYGKAAAVTLERIRDVVVRLVNAPEEPALAEPLRRAS